MMHRFVLLIIAVAVLAVSSLDDARAQSKYLGEDAHVQLKAIMAPTKPKPGQILGSTRPLTPVMTVPDGENVAYVCQRAPRATEAVLQYFQRNPAPLTRKQHVDVDAINKKNAQIAAYVSRALGKKGIVSEVYVVEGAGKAMARGTMSRLPFASIQGCSRVLEEYEQRVKEALGEKKK